MIEKIRKTIGPIFLILSCPPFAILMWYTNTALAGSFLTLKNMFVQQGFFNALYDIWKPVFFGTSTAWLLIFAFASCQLILMKYLPGKPFLGPVSPKGNVPEYKANGFLAFIVSITLFCVATFYLKLFSAAIIYDNLGPIFGALNILSLGVCLVLYCKGRFLPSSSDSGITGNFFFDYYWGTELYPKLFGLHIKKFITCRFGMMSWGVILISYAAKQYEFNGFVSNSMLISVFLQLLYITKFFLWETGYLRSLDIMHDRAGFYICWGCLVWVPCIYTSPSMYLVLHPITLSTLAAASILVLGSASVLINYLADKQRQAVRAANGHCKVWGKTPILIHAHYKTEEGVAKENVLLVSGWWGIARHFHYVPEIAASFLWSVPALFLNFSPYFYVTFLTILLVHRALRDEQRCLKKYGQYWKEYCAHVPYKIIPFVI
jgi:7-dehydrocholesterol reductase